MMCSRSTSRRPLCGEKKAGSNTITRAKGERIVAYLLGRSVEKDAHFRFWVKFRLMDYPALGLKDILCVPVKTKVRNSSIIG